MRTGLAVVAALAVLLALLFATTTAHFTECHGSFKSSEAANAAADEMADSGYDETKVENRDGEFAATFSSGETGKDAREFRKTFRAAVRNEGGELAHPGGGCSERQSFE